MLFRACVWRRPSIVLASWEKGSMSHLPSASGVVTFYWFCFGVDWYIKVSHTMRRRHTHSVMLKQLWLQAPVGPFETRFGWVGDEFHLAAFCSGSRRRVPLISLLFGVAEGTSTVCPSGRSGRWYSIFFGAWLKKINFWYQYKNSGDTDLTISEI